MSKQTSLFKFFNSPSGSTKKLILPDSDPQIPRTPKSSKKIENNTNGTPKRTLKELSPESVEKKVKRKRINVLPDSSDEDDIGCNILEQSKSTNSKSLADKFTFNSDDQSSKSNKNVKIDELKPEKMPHQTSSLGNERQFFHNTLEFLQPDKIRDKYKRRPNDPYYDAKTLFIPQKFLQEQTPAMRQWWEMKQDYFDCVLLFKLGKFYELYHMDAIVGVEELGFAYMKGNAAHCGFPEQAYGRMSSALVAKGYKIARVEQTETPEMMQERTKNIKKVDKVVRREICQITTKATQVYNTQDADPSRHQAQYLLAISEEIVQSDIISDKKCKIGACFVETSLAEFYVAQFEDDIHRSCLSLLLSQYPPNLILLSRGQKLSVKTKSLLQSSSLIDVKKEYLVDKKEFLSADGTIKFLENNGYFIDEDKNIKWPTVIKNMIKEISTYTWEPLPEYSLCLSALGAIVWYLNYSKVDDQLLTIKKFRTYIPDTANQTETKSESLFQSANTCMILDAITLYHLRLIDMPGSLYNKLDHCKTSFGKRLLRKWLCRPLCHVASIKERQEAICELNEMKSELTEIQKLLKELPDLERLLTRIHALGNKTRNTIHPDSRAILFEAKTYNKKKINDFCTTLDSFKKVYIIMKHFRNCNSTLLNRLSKFTSDGGDLPNLCSILEYFNRAFDQEEAKKTGRILPIAGENAEYDEVMKQIKEIEHELEIYRREQEKIFKCNVVYFGSDKKRYQIQIPSNKANLVGDEYYLEGATKGSKAVSRYSTDETKDFLTRMIAAEERKTDVLENTSRKLFEEFSIRYEDWSTIIENTATLDVLIALSIYSSSDEVEMCVPTVCEPVANQSFIEIIEGRHPCLSSPDFIPNSTNLGINGNSKMIVLTGPNMGGKSTLMRQVALISILAQIGCFVPADKCCLTIVDRIFTRMGARDDIIEGSSTFLVELQETNCILKYGTTNSLALLDEFGRGTSTHDGTSMAGGVAYFLANQGIRCIFSTHYHQLVGTYLMNVPNITLMHMMCHVNENINVKSDNEQDFDKKKNLGGDESVTFLYKTANGACPKSYGYNAARLAGIPENIIQMGLKISNDFDTELNIIRNFIKFNNMTIYENNLDKVFSLIEEFDA